ncbi:MAG TPA: hypothetical protein VJM49_10600, partial [Acidimicrobiales bacterium]|nr:hypothetical protein [Acidimicrobiales bacterium]
KAGTSGTADTTTGDAGTTAAAGRAASPRLDPDRLAALVDERDFLLRSLDDLEREHDAGDVDDHDYETLKDDYTARAARTIRAIESHHARVAAARRPRSWRRLVLTVAGVACFAVLAGVLVAQASGRRDSGEALTGDIRQSTRTQLAEAVQLASGGDYAGAIEIYDEVLADDPGNVEALTYKGWFQFLQGDSAGIDTLIAAAEADPSYPATHAFLAVILDRAGRPEMALAELDRLEALDPPDDILQFVAGLRERLEAEVAGGATGDSPPTTAPG